MKRFLSMFVFLFCFAGLTLASADGSEANRILDIENPDRLSESLTRVHRAYRYLHENPELGHQEYKAQTFIESELRIIGFTEFIRSKTAKTAVIAILDSGKPGSTIVLRAEMDARKTMEPKEHAPRSMIDGLMHNCGHDAHAAMLLGAAEILFRFRSILTGKIVFLFQPAEEVQGGADEIVSEGILQKLNIKAMIAQHVAPGMSVGSIAFAPGCIMAGSNYFTLEIEGKASHAADPAAGSDVPAATARIVADIVNLPARKLDILSRPAVISVTHIATGDPASNNILPNSALVKGTIRTFEPLEPAVRENAHSIAHLLRSYLDGVTSGLGVTYRLGLREGAPPTCNDPNLFEFAAKELRPLWQGNIDMSLNRVMFAEDFAFYTAIVPSLYIALGISKGGLGNAGVHTPNFTIHPDSLEHGIRVLVVMAQALQRYQSNR